MIIKCEICGRPDHNSEVHPESRCWREQGTQSGRLDCFERGYVRLKQDIAAAEERGRRQGVEARDELRAALRSVEWLLPPQGENPAYCLSCGGAQPHHVPGCLIDAALVPPDSGELCTCPPHDRELQSRGLLLRHVKACPLRTVLNAPVPDSDEREVCGYTDPEWVCTRQPRHSGGHLYRPADGALAPVSIELSLAQRILAALEEDLNPLAAELRVHLPKEPK